MMKNKTQHTNKIGIKKKIDLMDPKQNKLRAVTEKKPPLKFGIDCTIQSPEERL